MMDEHILDEQCNSETLNNVSIEFTHMVQLLFQWMSRIRLSQNMKNIKRSLIKIKKQQKKYA